LRVLFRASPPLHKGGSGGVMPSPSRRLRAFLRVLFRASPPLDKGGSRGVAGRYYGLDLWSLRPCYSGNRSSVVHPPSPPRIKGGKLFGHRGATKRVARECRVQPTGIESSTPHLEGSAPHLSPPPRGGRRFFPQPPQGGRRSMWNDPPKAGRRSEQE